MGKATLVLVTLAALGLGSLIGYSLVDDEQDATPADSVDSTAIMSTGGVPVFRYLGPDDVPDGWVEANSGSPFTLGENFVGRETTWKTETLTIELAADSRVEYKIFMSQGDSVLFDWSVNGEDIYYDLHAHDAAFDEEFYTRYDAGRGKERFGTIIAPYDGQHGWYWQNLEPDDEAITLRVAGFYDKIVKIDLE